MKLRWYEKLVIDRVKARKRALTITAGGPASSSMGIYHGAVSNRLTADWHPINQSADSETHQSLRVLRARSRDLARNNPYFSNFLNLTESNVIGPKGIRVQAQVRRGNGQYVADANEKIEKAFKSWGKIKSCDATGRLSWSDVQRLFVRGMMCEGEVILRVLYRGPFGLELQFIDPDWLDESFNDRDRNIVMSIEADEYGRPVAYHFKPPYYDLGSRTTGATRPVRVPAEEVIHMFIPERVNQTRGIPKCHTVMNKLNMLGGYEEAELVAARVSAAKMGFYLPPAGEVIATDEEFDLLDEVEPGTLMQLPEGFDFKPFDVDHPTTAFRDFTKSMLRAIAAGLNVSYNTLSVDLEGVSYSSVRQGSIQERDVWKLLQQWVIEHLCQPVFEKFLMINYSRLELPMRYFEQALEPQWRPRGFEWVDPQKDQNANVIAIENALACRTDIIAEAGDDFDEVIEQLAYEQRRIEELGLKLGPAVAEAPVEEEEEEVIEEEEDEEDEEDTEEEEGDETGKQAKAARGYLNGRTKERDLLSLS
jgi:lambda family phage portal protein